MSIKEIMTRIEKWYKETLLIAFEKEVCNYIFGEKSEREFENCVMMSVCDIFYIGTCQEWFNPLCVLLSFIVKLSHFVPKRSFNIYINYVWASVCVLDSQPNVIWMLCVLVPPLSFWQNPGYVNRAETECESGIWFETCVVCASFSFCGKSYIYKPPTYNPFFFFVTFACAWG